MGILTRSFTLLSFIGAGKITFPPKVIEVASLLKSIKLLVPISRKDWTPTSLKTTNQNSIKSIQSFCAGEYKNKVIKLWVLV